MWASKIKRKTNLIVPKVSYQGMNGSLNNENWSFKVTYAFRDALDIKYEQRTKDRKPYMLWTQGPILNFKEGDLIISQNCDKSVQVTFASPMGWDSAKNEMYEGSVTYDQYSVKNGEYIKLGEYISTQMNFLQLLIYNKIA